MTTELSFATISLDEIPPPQTRRSASKYVQIIADLPKLPPGRAAVLQYRSEAAVGAAKTALRKLAKAEKREILFSRSADKKTLYVRLA